MKSPRDELLDQIEAVLKEHVPGFAAPRALAGEIAKGWSVERKAHELRTGGPEEPDVYLRMETRARRFTDGELARLAERRWIDAWSSLSSPDNPPPPGVGWLELLGQVFWWKPKNGYPVRVEEMTETHLRNTLNLLDRNKMRLRVQQETRWLAGAPDEVQDEIDQTSDDEWFASQPLVQRLRGALDGFEEGRLHIPDL